MHVYMFASGGHYQLQEFPFWYWCHILHPSLSNLRLSILPLLLLLCWFGLLPTVAAGCSGHGDIRTAMLNLHRCAHACQHGAASV